RGQIEWFLDVVVGAHLQRFSFVIELVERGHHDHANRMTELWMLLHDTTYFPPVATRHHHVEQHNRRLHGLEESQCLLSACRHRDRVATNLEIFANDVGVVAIVVDYEDGWQLLGSHCSAPPRHEGDGRTHRAGA